MEKTNKANYNKYLILGIILVIILWFFIPYLVLHYNEFEDAGLIGDTFGSVNALFSALAFALLIYTAILQREELKLQREELILTRKELEKSATAQSTLVYLTEEQLKLSKTARRLSIMPELKLASFNLTEDSKSLNLSFMVMYNKLMFDSIQFDKITFNYFEENLELVPKINFIEIGKYVFINFKIKEKKFKNLEEITFNFIVKYRDVEGTLYYQLYQNHPQSLSSTTLVSDIVL